MRKKVVTTFYAQSVSNTRFTSIRKGHITGTLGSTEEEYYKYFPELKGKVATVLNEKISTGLKEMAFNDDGTPYLDKYCKHLTKFEVSKVKSMQTLNSIDPVTGKRRYDMFGEKTKNTVHSTLDVFERAGVLEIYNIIRQLNKTTKL
jgi:hypothetical protein